MSQLPVYPSAVSPRDISADPRVVPRSEGVLRVDGGKDCATLAEPAPKASRRSAKESKRRARSRHDPIIQSAMLLVTMGVMLAASRFAVPGIVEEIRYAWHRGELRAEYESGTDGLRNVSLDALSDAYQMVTAAVGPSVVHIEVQRRPSVDSAGMGRLIPGLSMSDQGSGVIVDAEGYLLTNRHVIADGEDITVTLSDGRRESAVIVGTDELTDLAVLKIDAKHLIPITWGDSDRCRVGSPVWAVGSPFGLDRTVTFGILSGKHRNVRASTQYQDFMQSDVAVNPGNSGGPLVDARGTLVGINTAIMGETYQGVSFSIPSNVVRQIYDRIRNTGHVERGWLGVELAEEVPDHLLQGDDRRVRGALVTAVPTSFATVQGDLPAVSPAGLAGVRRGDIILSIDKTAIRDRGHVMRVIGNTASGVIVKVRVARDDEVIVIDIELGSRPDLSLR